MCLYYEVVSIKLKITDYISLQKTDSQHKILRAVEKFLNIGVGRRVEVDLLNVDNSTIECKEKRHLALTALHIIGLVAIFPVSLIALTIREGLRKKFYHHNFIVVQDSQNFPSTPTTVLLETAKVVQKAVGKNDLVEVTSSQSFVNHRVETSLDLPPYLFDLPPPECESVEEYSALALKNIRFYLVEKAKLKQYPDICKNVTFVIQPNGGFGDILFIYKAVQALIKEGFNPSVCILGDNNMSSLEIKNQLKKMANMERVKIIASEDEDSTNLKPDCIIIGPTVPDSEKIKIIRTFSEVPLQIIYEYGGSRKEQFILHPYKSYLYCGLSLIKNDLNSFPIKSGIGVGEIGIFTENGLIQALSKEEKSVKLDRLKESYPEELGKILEDKNGEEYLSSTNLFFGYAHKEESMEKFVSTIAHAEREEQSNIDIILPWRLRNTQATFFNKKCTYDRLDLLEAGIGKVEIVTLHGTTFVNLSKDGSGKVLRIINLFPLPNQLMRELLTVSEAPVLITGDQSLSEALLISDKMIFYETMSWKVDLYRSLKTMSFPYPLVQNLMDLWDFKAPKEIAKGILDLSSKEGESQVEQYHKSIVNKKGYSLGENICLEALRVAALGKIPEFKEETENFETKIKEIFTLPMLIEKFSKFLLDPIMNRTSVTPEELRKQIPFIKLFKKEFNEVDKSSVGHDILKIMEMGIEMVDDLIANRKIDGEKQDQVRDHLREIPKLLFINIQKKLEELYKDLIIPSYKSKLSTNNEALGLGRILHATEEKTEENLLAERVGGGGPGLVEDSATYTPVGQISQISLDYPSYLLDPPPDECKDVSEYASLALKMTRNYLVEKAKLRDNSDIGRNVTLVLKAKNGQADVEFIYKASQALIKKGFTPSIFIMGVSVEPSDIKKKLNEMANMKGIVVATSQDEAITAFKSDCVIIGPKALDDTENYLITSFSKVPVQTIYGYEEDSSNSYRYKKYHNKSSSEIQKLLNDFPLRTGIGAGKIGVFKTDEFEQFSSNGDELQQGEDLEESICQEALRLSALGKIPSFKKDSEDFERNIMKIFKTPFLIEEFVLSLSECIAPRLKHSSYSDQVATIEMFKEKLSEISEGSVSQEVLDQIKRALEVLDEVGKSKWGDTEEKRTVIFSMLQKIPQLLFPQIQEGLKKLYSEIVVT